MDGQILMLMLATRWPASYPYAVQCGSAPRVLFRFDLSWTLEAHEVRYAVAV